MSGPSSDWFTRFSSTGFTATAAPHWGLSSDVAVPCEFVRSSSNGALMYFQWGLPSDLPVQSLTQGDRR